MLLRDVTNIKTSLRKSVIGDNSLIQKMFLKLYSLHFRKFANNITIKKLWYPFYKQVIRYCFCYIHLVDEAVGALHQSCRELPYTEIISLPARFPAAEPVTADHWPPVLHCFVHSPLLLSSHLPGTLCLANLLKSQKPQQFLVLPTSCTLRKTQPPSLKFTEACNTQHKLPPQY